MTHAPLHIGIDATTWSNDRGFGRFTRELVSALSGRTTGFRYTLLFDGPPAGELPPGVGSIIASTRKSLGASTAGDASRSLRYLWRVSRTARRASFDVFFFPAVYSYFPVWLDAPVVVCYHDTTAERMPELLFPTRLNATLWNAKTALARRQTARAMTVSESSARDLQRFLGFDADRIDVVTEGADPAFRVTQDPEAEALARARHGIPRSGDLLVYVGGFNRHKNVLGLLRAMPRIVAARPDVHVALVGSTSGEGFWDEVPALRAFVRDTPEIDAHVHFTGRVPDAELVGLLNAAAALVFPSLWEGFGLPAVEAMSCGAPVLASDRSSLPEIVGDAGRFFDPDDPASIADCVITFLADENLRRELAAKAVRRSRAFSWTRAAELAEHCFRRTSDDFIRR